MPQDARTSPLGGQRPASNVTPSFIPLWNAGSEAKYPWVILNPTIFGLFTHWSGERPIPCTLPIGRCRPCDEGWDRRFRGFLGAASMHTGKRYVVQITDWAYRHCPELVKHDGELRGRAFAIWREAGKKQGKLWWNALALRVEKPRINAVDLTAFLSKLFGLDLAGLAELPDFSGDVRPLLKPQGRGGREGRR